MTRAARRSLSVSKQRGIWLRCFLESRTLRSSTLFVALIGGFIVPHALRSQAICVGKNGKPCTDAEFKENVCNREKAPTNLFVGHRVRLSGTFSDPTGAPIAFDKLKPDYQTIVQIKSSVSGQILFAVPLSANGAFEFESVPAENYRLILVWMKDGVFHRLPLADQPKEIRCSDADECKSSSVITFHGTDNLVDFCPPK